VPASRGKDLAALAALLAATIFGTWLFLRHQLDLGAGWTDGTQTYDAVRGERIRYAVWDAPRPLGGEVNGEGRESRPALSPDGRWLVFASGERGLNADLWLAEMVGGEPVEPRPIGILNSPGDELAPAFGPDGIYFASDRAGPSFGLDLWRASFQDGAFGPPEPIGSGINTAADETDPCPLPGSRALLFSSDRPRGARVDHDLYLATPEEGAEGEERSTSFVTTSLEALNTPFEEREPAATSDGRTLVFASDRETARGFDLFRSFREDSGWLPPEPLVGVNTLRAERGPFLSADGFALFYDVEDDGAPADLWRASSKELFRLPASPLSMAEILLLLALFLLAILAWLSKRWRTIDVLYKCFLVSLLIHLLLLWYLREVYPESGPVELRGEEQTFRVRLAPSPDGTPSAARERAGELELSARLVEASESAPSRAESGLELAAAAPARNEVAAPERELEAPARKDAQLEESRSLESRPTTLEQRDAPFEPRAEPAPGLALDAREAVAAPTAAESATPNRASTTARAQRAQPNATTVVVERDAADSGADAPGPVRLAEVQDTGLPQRTEVAQPREVFETARSEAPDLRLPETTAAAAPARRTGAATRREAGLEVPVFLSGEARPTTGSPSLRAAEEPVHDEPTGPRAPFLDARETLVARGDPEALVREVHEIAFDARASESRRFDPAAEPPSTTPERFDAAADERTPERFDVSPREAPRNDAVPARRELAGLEPVRDPEQTAERPAGLSARDPVRRPDADEPAVAVRAVEEALPGAREVAPEPRRFDPTADLAPAEPTPFRRAAKDDLARPRRFEPEREAVPPARPSFTPSLAAVDPPRADALDAAPARLEHTPYKNRFGEEKLRALEEFGGSIETERAVAAGLAYLASIQDFAGCWGERRDFHDKYHDVRVGKTGLSLLAFLGAGHTQLSMTEYSGVAEKAIQFLLGVQSDRNGHFGDCSSYGHGIATYALAECYALTQDVRLRRPLERAVRRIVSQQSERDDPRHRGGWGYYFEDDHVWNRDEWPRVSVTAWQVMALESAKLGGLEVEGGVFDGALRFLLDAWDPRRGAFRYSHDPGRLNGGYPILPASTPAALFALSLLGVDVSRRELDEARRFVLERAPADYNYRSDDDFVFRAVGNLYFWYYGTLAMFRIGGTEWNRWNAAMKDTLLEGQEQDGSWEPISIYAAYAGDDDAERSYSTAMCVLTLEVYYRYFTPLLTAR